MPQTITAKSGEILEVAEVKRYLRIPDNVNDEDAEISSMIVAARMEAERISHRTLRASVTRVDLRTHWFHRFEFLNPPLHTTPAITVKYYDASNVLTTVDASDYFLNPPVTTGDEQEGVSHIDFDTFFSHPILYAQRPTDRIEITYTTGYVTQAAIPEVAKRAVKIMVWDDYYGDANELNLRRAKQSLGAIAFGFYA